MAKRKSANPLPMPDGPIHNTSRRSRMLDMFENYKPVCLPKWIDREAT